MDESTGHRYLGLEGLRSFVAWKALEVEANGFGHSHRQS